MGRYGEGELDSRHQSRIEARIEDGMECLPHSDFQRYHGHIARLLERGAFGPERKSRY